MSPLLLLAVVGIAVVALAMTGLMIFLLFGRKDEPRKD